MNLLLRILGILALLFVALFCAFGFLATAEPMPAGRRLLSQLIYGGGGVVCMFGILRLLTTRSR